MAYIIVYFSLFVKRENQKYIYTERNKNVFLYQVEIRKQG